MSATTLFITGTDTGVGKTVLTALLVRHLRVRGVRARAVKPLGSGGRADARLLRAAQEGDLSLDAINPWNFRAPLAPMLAALIEGGEVTRADVLRYLRAQQRTCDVLLIEGAGGLLTPLGAGFDAVNLIAALDAVPVIVCPNRLGAINQSRLALAALPRRFVDRTRLVLVAPALPDASLATNAELLREFIGAERVIRLPHLTAPRDPARSLRRASVRAAVDAILSATC